MRRLLASLLVLGVACTGDGGGGGPGTGGRGGGAAGGRGGTTAGTGGSANGGGGAGGSTAGSSAGGSSAGAGGSTAGTGANAGTGGGASGGAGAAGSAGRGGTSGGGGGLAGRGGAGGSGGAAGGSAGRGGTGGGAGRGGTGGSAGAAGGGAGRGGTGGSAAGTGGTTGSGGTTSVAGLFDLPHPWTTDVSGYPKAATSDTIINGLIAAGGWGQNNQFLTDASILILADDGSAPTRTFTRTADFYTPDCDNVPFPVPAGGAIEGETGYACTGNGDCHLLVVQRAQKKLFEMWRANITGTSVAEFRAGCVAVWDLSKQYGSTLRGKGCSSADAGGFPITAMLATSDEVAAGRVGHALRFILPNDRIRDGIYVPPGTHSTGPTAGGPATPPYGVRFRLKASFDTSGLSSGAKVLAQALKTYGMFLADGGNIALTIASDKFSTAKWSALGVSNNRSLASITVGDFEVVDYGTEVDWKADTDCVRNP
jgi:serine/threonine-protein kinase